MYQLHKMYQQKLNVPKDKIIKESTREREQAKCDKRKLECELRRVEAELSQFVMGREKSNSYYYDKFDHKVLGFQLALTDYELNAIRANPDILDRILYYQIKKSVRDLICKEL